MVKNNVMGKLVASCQLLVTNYRLTIIIVICLFFAACFQPENGCLDVEATNFELTADEPCDGDDSADSCPCIYPVLSFGELDYVVEKVDYQPDAFYRIDSQYIRIQSIRFYLSGISLVLLNDENELSTQLLIDDFVLINQQRSIELGAIKQHGTFDSLRFVLGVEPPANTAAPDSIMNTSHPLAETEMHTGNQETGYIFNQLIFNRDTLFDTDTITLNIAAADFQSQPSLMELKMPFSYETPIGADFSIGTLQIDHAQWFDGINFVVDTEAIMIGKIVANTPKVFSISN